MSGGLLQISEPGESKVKQSCVVPGRAVGIDLGTTNSLIALVVGGKPRCFPVDEAGAALLPSAVEYFADRAPLVGKQALADAPARPTDTIVSVKRFMGRSPKDAESTRRFTPYQFAATDGPVVRFRVAGAREVTPIEVSAEILRALRKVAESQLPPSTIELESGAPTLAAVVTVPAYFDDAQRQATKDAGRLAGLEVLRLLNEPTAAALAYGLDKKSQGTFAVYDLGGGTFDISILQLTEGVFEVKSTAGDTALGGDDFDRALADLIVKKAGVTVEGAAGRALLSLARHVKHRLTDDAKVSDTIDGKPFTVDRAEFEAAIAPILARTQLACRRALKDARLEPSGLDGVILVGGATRTPAVRRFVAELFQREPLADIDPDQVVALGAAVQADLLAGSSLPDDVLLLDVIPLSLGLEMMGGVVEKLVPRNSTIPTGAKQTFTTYADNQTGFDLHVVQGERETAAECRSLARFQLKGIRPGPAGKERLEVTFLVDADGILHVTARDEGTGKEASIDVKPSYGLSDEEVERMLLASYEHAEEDVTARLLAEARVEAERILSATRIALARDGERLLSSHERAAIEAAAARLDEARRAADHTAINDAVKALDAASQEFAQRRMNDELGRSMAGRSVGDVEQRIEKSHDHPHHDPK